MVAATDRIGRSLEVASLAERFGEGSRMNWSYARDDPRSPGELIPPTLPGPLSAFVLYSSLIRPPSSEPDQLTGKHRAILWGKQSREKFHINEAPYINPYPSEDLIVL